MIGKCIVKKIMLVKDWHVLFLFISCRIKEESFQFVCVFFKNKYFFKTKIPQCSLYFLETTATISTRLQRNYRNLYTYYFDLTLRKLPKIWENARKSNEDHHRIMKEVERCYKFVVFACKKLTFFFNYKYGL